MSSFDKNLLDVQTYYLDDFFLLSLHCSFILCNIFDLFILSLFFGFIVNKFSMFNIASLFFLAFLLLLVYLFFSIYFSMCYLASLKLRIAMPIFEKFLSIYTEYYFDKFFSISLHYLFILCHMIIFHIMIIFWWAQMESNHRPHAYQACALTIWAMSPYFRVFFQVLPSLVSFTLKFNVLFSKVHWKINNKLSLWLRLNFVLLCQTSVKISSMY